MNAFKGITFTAAAAALTAGLSMAAPAYAQSACAEPLDRALEAYSPSGLHFGHVTAAVKDESGEAVGYVLQREGIMYGYTGRSQLLPADFVTIAAGRAKIQVRTEADVDGFPGYSC